MKNYVLLILVISLGVLSCSKDENNPYLITASQVGPLKKDIRINQLDSIFKEDSIVMQSGNIQQLRNTNEVKIFDKDGASLLVLEPHQEFDSTSTIGYIRIIDPRYKTKAGITVDSRFKDILENYSISRIENTINSAVIFVDELNAYFTIDKKELPSNLRYDTDIAIKASQIPDNAKFKYFMIYWN